MVIASQCVRASLAATVLMLAAPAAALPANLDAHYARYRMTDSAELALTSSRYHRCMNNAEGTTVYLLDCIGAEYDRTDALLNARYRQLMASLTAPQRERLRASERRWLATREGPCIANQDSGTLGNITRNMCMLTELRRRLLWLRAIN